VKAQEFKRLQEHVQEYARQHGVEANLWREDMLGSDVNPPGPRIHMSLLRRAEGQPPREHPHKVAGYRPDAPDLRTILERDITDAARALYKTP
jgi:hypothetical protein